MILDSVRRRAITEAHAGQTGDQPGDNDMSSGDDHVNRLPPASWELPHHLHRGSSEIDWCESNYAVSTTIAEFVNTFSNVLFIIIPPLLIILFQQYAKRTKSKAIYVIWLLLIVVGMASAYFHATLSFAGQMLDELAILWLICAGVSLWIPARYLPYLTSRYLPLQMNRYGFKWAMFAITIIGTILSCIKPVINAFALLAIGVPITVMLVVEMRRCQDEKIRRLGFRTCVLFVTAVCCWLNDRLLCDLWTKFRFPYLHGFWHILVFLSSYACCVLFAFFDASEIAPEFTPKLRYWPLDTFEFGVPYITLQSRTKEIKRDM
ncbi:Alkaline ceramidase [Hypsibius exemplaris]|uniref:Alkaline ceramidase n=1 Tax=Hypsibius exemplaris TaxID=2072580 RepID=A0A1W0XCZ2_HYPEX|nr:Alkaline ceramidase [Hypsibius exemplaris]